MLALIDRKAAGEEVVASPSHEEPAKVLDLMAALEASLARTGARQAAAGDADAAVDTETDADALRPRGLRPRRQVAKAAAGQESRGEEGPGSQGRCTQGAREARSQVRVS